MPLVSGKYAVKNTAWLQAGAPTGTWRENFERKMINTDLAALTTQIMTVVGIPLQAGDLVTNISFKSGATALATGTNWWFALYDNSATPVLLAQTADQTSGAWAATTTKTLALTTAQTITTAGIYYLAVMVKATTVPTLVGFTGLAAGSGGVLTADKSLALTSGSALTTTAPATLATPTNVATIPYATVS